MSRATDRLGETLAEALSEIIKEELQDAVDEATQTIDPENIDGLDDFVADSINSKLEDFEPEVDADDIHGLENEIENTIEHYVRDGGIDDKVKEGATDVLNEFRENEPAFITDIVIEYLHSPKGQELLDKTVAKSLQQVLQTFIVNTVFQNNPQ